MAPISCEQSALSAPFKSSNSINNAIPKNRIYLGLARTYTELDDKPNAIKNWEIAIANLPENRKFFQTTLKKLKEDS